MQSFQEALTPFVFHRALPAKTPLLCPLLLEPISSKNVSILVISRVFFPQMCFSVLVFDLPPIFRDFFVYLTWVESNQPDKTRPDMTWPNLTWSNLSFVLEGKSIMDSRNLIPIVREVPDSHRVGPPCQCLFLSTIKNVKFLTLRSQASFSGAFLFSSFHFLHWRNIVCSDVSNSSQK